MNKQKIGIITHRGLDPDRTPYFKESSREAFADQLSRGYGLEFDVQFTRDNRMIVIHDSKLSRLTEGRDNRSISEIDLVELLAMDFGGNHLTTIFDVLNMIETSSAPGSLSALHVKHMHQIPERLDAILEALIAINSDKLVVFDITVDTAKYLKQRNSRLHLAPSVSHPHDIARYNSAVGGTLMTIDTVLSNRDFFDWVWLDEWDLTSPDGGKTLYNRETFDIIRQDGMQIALVTPELHSTSPGLLGGEAHEDARDRETLNKRLAEIISLQPDAICTDHPDYVRSLINTSL